MRVKVNSGWLDIDFSRGAIDDISAKLKKIASKEKEGLAFKDIVKEKSVRELETLKRPGDPEIMAGGK